ILHFLRDRSIRSTPRRMEEAAAQKPDRRAPLDGNQQSAFCMCYRESPHESQLGCGRTTGGTSKTPDGGKVLSPHRHCAGNRKLQQLGWRLTRSCGVEKMES